MFTETDGVLNTILSIILFPMLFQEAFVNFAWGAGDPALMMIFKRLLLIMPVFAFIAACWISIIALITVVFRHDRQNFVVALVMTWWDLGKAVFSFWGGIIKFIFSLLYAIFGFLKIIVFGVWSIIQDIIMIPFRLLASVGRNVTGSAVPWIAVSLTLFWCLIEAVIFTYVATPLVIDAFSNITGEQLALNAIRIPLFVFLFFIVLGSYAVLSTFVESAKSKKISHILGIGAIELIVLLVEVVFLYREFVDSLVPWFAQYSDNFELGILGTLAISCFVWFGIRSLSWFLFAAHGTPTLLKIIRGKGLAAPENSGQPSAPIRFFEKSTEFFGQIKADADWIQIKGEDLLTAFMLPPLQVIAATVNFFMLLLTSKHMFELPFKSMGEITASRVLIDTLSKPESTPSSPKKSERPAPRQQKYGFDENKDDQ